MASQPSSIKLKPAPEEAPKFSPSYTFRLRRHSQGNFSNLWELARLDQFGNVVEVIDDANALNFCIDNLVGRIENDGY